MLISSVRTQTMLWPLSSCLAITLDRRPIRCPRQSMMIGLDMMTSSGVGPNSRNTHTHTRQAHEPLCRLVAARLCKHIETTTHKDP